MDDENKKFALECTCSNLVEAGKNAGAALLLYLALAAITAILVFSNTATSQVSIPLLNISLNKWDASKVLIVLISLTYYQLIAFHNYQKLLYLKAELLLTEGDAKRIFHWYLYFPSLFFFLETIADSTPGSVRYPALIFNIVLLLSGVALPVYLLVVVGKATHFGVSWWVSGGLSGFILLCSALMLFGLEYSRRSTLEKLENY